MIGTARYQDVLMKMRYPHLQVYLAVQIGLPLPLKLNVYIKMTVKEDLAFEYESFLPQTYALLGHKKMLQRAVELQDGHPPRRRTSVVRDAASTE